MGALQTTCRHALLANATPAASERTPTTHQQKSKKERKSYCLFRRVVERERKRRALRGAPSCDAGEQGEEGGGGGGILRKRLATVWRRTRGDEHVRKTPGESRQK